MSKLIKKRGFTMIELIVSMGLFFLLLSLVSATFINTIRTQRVIRDLSDSMNNASFAVEQIAREVRVGFQFTGGGNSLQFINPSGSTIMYNFTGSGIERCEDAVCGIITAENVNIDDLQFVLQGHNPGGIPDNEPPRVTILISVIGQKDIGVDLQTTVSARNLDT